jgi:hypothetical protein
MNRYSTLFAIAEPSAPAHNTGHDVWPEVSCEREILALLEAPLAGPTIEVAHGQRERELGEMFARLSVTDSRALHRRLANPSPRDPIASRFGLMIAERRQRLLSFLAGARRREALGLVRR